jgi:uncharacterized membrane protein
MTNQQTPTANGSSSLDRLRSELVEYLGARATKLAESAGGRLTGVTDRLTEAGPKGGDGGMLREAAGAVLGGESPVKAAVAKKAKDAKESVTGKLKEAVGGGKGGRKGEALKATNIVETVDIGAPLRTVYDHWTQFEEFSSFMNGVVNVTRKDETTSDWRVKVAMSNRTWKATIEEQVPDERIVWSSEGDKGSTHGAVSFHELAPNLTRVVVVVEYSPSGFFEKTGNLWRAQGRRLRLDLKHFQRHVTLHADEEIEGWRGEIRDSEVVRSHEEALDEDREDEDDGNDDFEDEEEDEDEYEDDDEDDEDEE